MTNTEGDDMKNEGVGTDELEQLMLEDQQNNDIVSSILSNRSNN